MPAKLSPEELKRRKSLRVAIYYQANKEKIKARQKVVSVEYRIKNPNRNILWKQNNPEKYCTMRDAYANKRYTYDKQYREINKERRTEYLKEWRVANKEKMRLYWQNRGRRKSTGTLTKGLIDKLLKTQDYQCIYCGIDLRTNGYQIDHIMPLALGGLNIDKNIQLTCAPCNLKKGYKHPDLFKQDVLGTFLQEVL